MNVAAFSAAARQPSTWIGRLPALTLAPLGGLRCIANSARLPPHRIESPKSVLVRTSWKDAWRRPLGQKLFCHTVRTGDKATRREEIEPPPKPTDPRTPLKPPPPLEPDITTNSLATRSLLSHLVHPFTIFSNAQRRRPLTTQFLASIMIYALADMIAQHYQTVPDDPYSPGRTARMMTIGGLASTPSYWWFGFLGRHFNYASLPLSLAAKVVVQQCIFAPVFNIYFFAMQAFLERKGMWEIVERVQKTLPDSLKNSVKLWPAVTALNFWLVEARFRMFVAMLVAVGWQGYLSWLNSAAARGRPVNRSHLLGRGDGPDKKKNLQWGRVNWRSPAPT